METMPDAAVSTSAPGLIIGAAARGRLSPRYDGRDTLATMDSRSRTRARSLAAAVAVPAAAAVLLAGCSQQDDPATVTETAVHTAMSTVTGAPTETAAETPTETETETTTTSSSSAAPDCEADSGDNPLTGDDPLPVRFAGEDTEESGVFFHYTVSEDEMDACQPLSWVVLNGGNGTQDNPNGTAGSSNQTVALFADGELVTEPAPILARYIESVDRIDDSTVQVNYEFLGDQPAAANVTVPASATFHWDGSEVQVGDNSIPAELNDTAATLDLSSLG